MSDPQRRHRLPASHRLGGRRAFAAVYEQGQRRQVGPLTVWARPNELDHVRLGLSVSRRVGAAVRRNRIKRLLREAFRLSQHDWPTGYDVVISVRQHDPVTLAEYQRMLFGAMRALHQRWQKSGQREQERR